MFFQYGEKETDYLSKADKKLSKVIKQIGHINREVDTDLFSAVTHQIIAQQISNVALETVWERLNGLIKKIDAKNILALDRLDFQKIGISFKKVDYIRDFAQKVEDGDFDLDSLYSLSDEEVSKKLVSLKGVGEWTAEMIMIFCMQRPNILSFSDLAIQRGMCRLYSLSKIDEETFEKCRKTYSPYCTVASLYLWEVASDTVAI